MQRIILLLAPIAVLSLLPALPAGVYNDVLSIGDFAPAWTELPGVDGKAHSLADLKDKDVVVVVFTCNSCPVAVAYEDRIIAFNKKHCGPDGKVALVAINVNVNPEDRLPKMRERAKEKGFTFQYLHDPTQKIAKDYGAMYTPEFFVLNKERKIAYMGTMDDRSLEKDVKENYLEPALAAALKGEKAKVAETRARGCLIRYVRKRE
jgi:peroxiredoxin